MGTLADSAIRLLLPEVLKKGRKHEYTYAMLPHSGDWKDAGLYRHGLELNNPLIVRKSTAHTGNLPSTNSFIQFDKSNVIITCVKREAAV